MKENQQIELIIRMIARLPGLGPRSSRRILLYMLDNKQKIMEPLIKALTAARDEIIVCEECGNIDFKSPCYICLDEKRKDNRKMILVQNIADVWALERAGVFDGIYHVIGTELDAASGTGPEKLNTKNLVHRITKMKIKEVILAMSATVGGQATAFFISDMLTQATNETKITRLACGMPIGGELEYLDEGTLNAAISARTIFQQ